MFECEKDMERRAKKEEIKNEWEKAFGMKISEKLNKKGIDKFWDDNTSLSEAIDLLTAAAFDELLCDIIDDIAGIIVVSNKEKKSEEKYQVYNKVGNYFLEESFESIDDAKEFIREKALNTKYKVDDFKVVRMYE